MPLSLFYQYMMGKVHSACLDRLRLTTQQLRLLKENASCGFHWGCLRSALKKNTSHHCVHVYAHRSQEKVSEKNTSHHVSMYMLIEVRRGCQIPCTCSYRRCESAVLWALGTERGCLWQQPLLLTTEPSTSPAPRSAFLENKVKQGMGTRKRPALVMKVYLLSRSSVSNLDALFHLLWTLFLGLYNVNIM